MKKSKYMETIAPKAPGQPFSLHDAHITRMVAKPNKLKLKFKEGFYYPHKGDALPIQGSVLLKGIDYDFSNLTILDVSGGRGKLKGRRWSVKKFAHKFPDIDMEIVDVNFSHYQIVLSGMLYEEDSWKEWSMDIFYTGDMVYLTEYWKKRKKK